MKYSEGNIGRVIVARFDDGEEMVSGMRELMTRTGISSGVILFLGALRSGEPVVGPVVDELPPTPSWLKFGSSLLDRFQEFLAVLELAVLGRRDTVAPVGGVERAQRPLKLDVAFLDKRAVARLVDAEHRQCAGGKFEYGFHGVRDGAVVMESELPAVARYRAGRLFADEPADEVQEVDAPVPDQSKSDCSFRWKIFARGKMSQVVGMSNPHWDDDGLFSKKPENVLKLVFEYAKSVSPVKKPDAR